MPGTLIFFRLVTSLPGYLTVYSTGSTDVAAYLKDSFCDETIADDDDSGEGTNFYIRTPLLDPGTINLGVVHYSPSGTGPYTIVVNFQPVVANKSKLPGVLMLLLDAP